LALLCAPCRGDIMATKINKPAKVMFVRIYLRPDGRFNVYGICEDVTIFSRYAVSEYAQVVTEVIMNGDTDMTDLTVVHEVL
jgi:hypothetical protein